MDASEFWKTVNSPNKVYVLVMKYGEVKVLTSGRIERSGRLDLIDKLFWLTDPKTGKEYRYWYSQVEDVFG